MRLKLVVSITDTDARPGSRHRAGRRRRESLRWGWIRRRCRWRTSCRVGVDGLVGGGVDHRHGEPARVGDVELLAVGAEQQGAGPGPRLNVVGEPVVRLGIDLLPRSRCRSPDRPVGRVGHEHPPVGGDGHGRWCGPRRHEALVEYCSGETYTDTAALVVCWPSLTATVNESVSGVAVSPAAIRAVARLGVGCRRRWSDSAPRCPSRVRSPRRRSVGCSPDRWRFGASHHTVTEFGTPMGWGGTVGASWAGPVRMPRMSLPARCFRCWSAATAGARGRPAVGSPTCAGACRQPAAPVPRASRPVWPGHRTSVAPVLRRPAR